MTPPIWLDEARRRVPHLPLTVCGHETPRFRLHGRHLRLRSRMAPLPSGGASELVRASQGDGDLPDGTGWSQKIPVVEGDVRGDTSVRPQATPSRPVHHTGP